MTLHKVKIADLAVLKDEGVLITIGLGSCVGIALYDGIARVAGLAHVLLSDSSQFSHKVNTDINPAKFADTAIPNLIQLMEDQGAKKARLRAKIAGGGQLFSFNSNVIRVGDKNIGMVKKKLKEYSVPLLGENVGGNYGRTMKIEVETGMVYIYTVGREEIRL